MSIKGFTSRLTQIDPNSSTIGPALSTGGLYWRSLYWSSQSICEDKYERDASHFSDRGFFSQIGPISLTTRTAMANDLPSCAIHSRTWPQRHTTLDAKPPISIRPTSRCSSNIFLVRQRNNLWLLLHAKKLWRPIPTYSKRTHTRQYVPSTQVPCIFLVCQIPIYGSSDAKKPLKACTSWSTVQGVHFIQRVCLGSSVLVSVVYAQWNTDTTSRCYESSFYPAVYASNGDTLGPKRSFPLYADGRLLQNTTTASTYNAWPRSFSLTTHLSWLRSLRIPSLSCCLGSNVVQPVCFDWSDYIQRSLSLGFPLTTLSTVPKWKRNRIHPKVANINAPVE